MCVPLPVRLCLCASDMYDTFDESDAYATSAFGSETEAQPTSIPPLLQYYHPCGTTTHAVLLPMRRSPCTLEFPGVPWR